MKFSPLVRFLRARRTYWTVVQELSAHSDRELHDIGVDRADIHEIARVASRGTAETQPVDRRRHPAAIISPKSPSCVATGVTS